MDYIRYRIYFIVRCFCGVSLFVSVLWRFQNSITYSKDLVVADAKYEDLSKIVSFVSSIECYSTLFSKYDK